MKCCLLAFTGALAGAVSAPAAEFKATDAAAPASAVTYQSGFEGYKPFREEAISDWRGLNNQVRDVGGHAGIFGGGAAHGAHGAAKPPAQPVGPTPAAGGQQPVRGAPQAPASKAHH